MNEIFKDTGKSENTSLQHKFNLKKQTQQTKLMRNAKNPEILTFYLEGLI